MKTNKMVHCKYIAFILVVLLSSMLTAQETFTLKDSKEAALNYSKAIKNGDIRLEQAAAAKKEALSHYFPSISATGIGLYGFDDIISPIQGLVPTGIDNIYFASVTANEVLYAGGKVQHANEMAVLQSDVYKIQATQSKDSVVLMTSQKFWNIIELQEQMKVLESTEQYLNKLLEQQQDLLDAGLIARNDQLKVKAEKNRLLLNKSKLNNGRKLALLDFALYTGMKYDTTMVALAEFEDVDNPKLTYQTADTVVTNNSSYQLMQKSVEAKELQVQISNAELLPSISVGISGTQFGSFDNAIDSRFVPVAMGVISIPISDWWGAGRQKVKQDKLAIEIAKNNLEDVKDKLHVAVLQSWYNLTDAYEQIRFAEINNEQATENLEVSTDNYNAGLAGLTDLLDAQRLQQQAAADLVNAYANYKKMEVVYLFRTNNLLGED
ncbi:TolC family protein [Neptunitalea lumnitzerae]|nr:TolC family protein [Neptunitalea sp. Y10]